MYKQCWVKYALSNSTLNCQLGKGACEMQTLYVQDWILELLELTKDANALTCNYMILIYMHDFHNSNARIQSIYENKKLTKNLKSNCKFKSNLIYSIKVGNWLITKIQNSLTLC